jgi:hypothetical protein
MTAGLQLAALLLATALQTVSVIARDRLSRLELIFRTLKEFPKLLAIDSVPLTYKDVALVIYMHLGMPGQTVVTSVNLIGLPSLVEGR